MTLPLADRSRLGFASPPLLWGLAAASLPIIIHLLNRRKFREMPWAAMRFLLAAIRKNQRRIRIEQWILLAVRTLIIICRRRWRWPSRSSKAWGRCRSWRASARTGCSCSTAR